MTKTPVTKTPLHLVACCSLALLVASAGGAALAHGGGGHIGSDHFGNGGDHAGNFGHGRCLGCGGGLAGGTHYTGHNVDGGYWHHRHGPGGLGKVHGPGSSHNPIVYHPPVRPVRPPVTAAGPAKLPKNPNPTFCQLQAAGANVTDHRGWRPHPLNCRGARP